MLDNGATTIWERWEHVRGGGMSSHNHPMYATVSGWLSRYLGGIRASEAGPGFAEVVVQPYVPAELAWSETSLETVRGRVLSAWRRAGAGSVEYHIIVPPSSTARLELSGPEEGTWPASLGLPRILRGPDGTRCAWRVGGGEYRIVMRR